jgi:hypothetical protein
MKWRMRAKRCGVDVGEYNWHKFKECKDRWLFKFAGILHYYTSHAPKPVSLNWRQANIRFYKRLPVNATMRYLSKYSIDRNI